MTSSRRRAAACAAWCCSGRRTASRCRGLAAPSVEAFATPLGPVRIDREAIASVRELPQVVINDAAHALEHSLEVQLPFLQEVLGDFALVPFAVGAASVEQVAEVLERLWGGAETLIVVSTDMSHYHSYEQARAIDRVRRSSASRALRPTSITKRPAARRR